jgi:hypothetical protein
VRVVRTPGAWLIGASWVKPLPQMSFRYVHVHLGWWLLTLKVNR